MNISCIDFYLNLLTNFVLMVFIIMTLTNFVNTCPEIRYYIYAILILSMINVVFSSIFVGSSNYIDLAVLEYMNAGKNIMFVTNILIIILMIKLNIILKQCQNITNTMFFKEDIFTKIVYYGILPIMVITNLISVFKSVDIKLEITRCL